MVPNSPGGGYDTTARAAAKVIEDESSPSGVEVFNLEGAGGTVGLQRLVNEKGNDELLMPMGLGVVGAAYTQQVRGDLDADHPDRRADRGGRRRSSSRRTPRTRRIDDLVAAWKADPGDIPVGGGSIPGGPDHLIPMLLAQAVGVDPTDVNYVAYDGGGELLAGPARRRRSTFGASGIGEFPSQIEAGQLRVLAVTSERAASRASTPRP